MKILALCDSPTLSSGFARVAQNLFRRWKAEGAHIEVWGIGFKGWGYNRCPYVDVIYPAGDGGEWASLPRLELFLKQLASGGYTHLWMMQDTFMLSRGNFPQRLRELCNQRGIRSMLYFPVDAPLDPEWTDIIAAVDLPVAYTEYGKQEAEKKGADRGHAIECAVIPHGVDTGLYKPVPNRAALRDTLWHQKWLGPDDFLMLNVNANQRRKDVTRSLELLAEVRRLGVPAKLLMHMPEASHEGLSLSHVARQLGFAELKEWAHHGVYFRNGNALLTEDQLPKYYNAADLYVTTTLGEGWGLGITEALACGCPVALPMHTACEEIFNRVTAAPGGESRMVGLPTEYWGVVLDGDNSRIRHRVDVARAAQFIKDYYDSGQWRNRPHLPDEVEHWLSWGRIASEMLRTLRRREFPQAKGRQYYMEFGGGLGDVFNQMYDRGTYNVLRDLQPGESAKVVLISHNPFVKELFEHHPKRHQLQIHDLGYWHGVEADCQARKLHQLPPPGENRKLPEKDSDFVFHCPVADDELIAAIPKPFIVLALAAGLPDRTIPEKIVEQILPALRAAGYTLVSTGRTYDRHGRKEFSLNMYNADVIDAVDHLTVPGTTKLVQASAGLITCHSALNILAWQLHKPQLLLYPRSVYERHIVPKDQWAFGVDQPQTIHAQFDDFTPELLQQFLSVLPPVQKLTRALA